jgi:dTDP-3-amino-2,3,6-trideoxy-4-keto-D-glucose/dTDP-3-amino-3,4,6-trideoxy-alpha-D-glucose/dTDP-2,6-dideoxy-D-kanosamine transaminase
LVSRSTPVDVPLNDLGRGYREQQAEIDSAIQSVLRSGWYVMGPEHDRFEQDFASLTGTRSALGVASGTDALTLILVALAARSGAARRCVLTAANAGGYTAVAAASAGLEVRFVDVDPFTHCLDPVALTAELNERADSVVAVVVTHLYGRVADVDRLLEICRATGVPLVEDCAQAAGAAHPDGPAGSIGIAGAFSFYPTKNLGALGDGGAVVSSDEELIEDVRRLRQYGWSKKYYRLLPRGINSRLDEVQAAVLNVRLPRLDAWNMRRRAIIDAYVSASPEGVGVLPAVGPSHVGHLAVVVTPERARLQRHLTGQGIGHDVHYPVPDHLQPAVAERNERQPQHLPVTERLAQQVLTLPCFPQLRDAEVERVCDALAAR